MDFTQLVIAAAAAAGPAVPGEEAAWERRVQGLAVRLAALVPQVAQDATALDNAHRFPAYLERIEIEPSGRGLLTLRPSGGVPEAIRTDHGNTNRGAEMIARARELEGRWVLVYRVNEPKSSNARGDFDTVRMVIHLLDLGEGSLAFAVAKEIVTADAGGDAALAANVWRTAGLPTRGMIPVADLDQVRATARERAAAARLANPEIAR